MREHLGEEYGGVVTSAATLRHLLSRWTLYVEGLVHITELGGEYFRFDEARQELRGERTGMRYAIGTRVRVQVSRVDLDGRKIDFRLVRDGEHPMRAVAARPSAAPAVRQPPIARRAHRPRAGAPVATAKQPARATPKQEKPGADGFRRRRLQSVQEFRG
jgi:ribonuclease R